MSSLDEFLKAAKSSGASDEFLVAMLRERGWPAKSIYEALGRHYAELTGVPLPESRGKLEAAREAFLHLLAFSTLGTWICSLGSLCFELINGWFPDAVEQYGWRWSRISWQLAYVIVAFPVFVWATSSTLKSLKLVPESAESPVRKWLTNIALWITALVFIGDIVTFLATFLEGGLTSRFVLKCLVVLILAGAVFLYYNKGLSATAPAAWNRNFAIAAGVSILLVVSMGFMRWEGPSVHRAQAEDRRRLQDLYGVSMAVYRHYESNNRQLPPSLTELPESIVRIDPFTQRPYEYRALDATRYELCAVFASKTERPATPADTWVHPSGRHCFENIATRYPEYPNVN